MDKYEQLQEQRLQQIEDAIKTLNKEMGVVQGELKWITKLTAATAIAVWGQLVLRLFGF